MNGPAQSKSSKEMPHPNRAYIEHEIARVRFLYETLYPETMIDTHLWWDRANIPTPAVVDPDANIEAAHLSLSYLGNVTFGPDNPTPHKRAHVTITGKKIASADNTPWKALKLTSRIAYQTFPPFAEHLKYLVEQRRERDQTKHHRHSRLTCSTGAIYPPVAMAKNTHRTPSILIGFHWLEVGGAESLAFDTVQWARDCGLRVFVLVDRAGPQRLAQKLNDMEGVHLLGNEQYLPRHLSSTFIRNLIQQENIILTHNHHCGLLYNALPTIKLSHPDVVNLDSTHITEYWDGGFPRVSGVWGNYLDFHHVISNELANYYRKHFLSTRKIRMGRLLDPDRRQNAPQPVRIRAGNTRCRVAFVGRMVHQKRPLLVLAIMAKLKKWGKGNGVEFAFDMVGEGRQLETLKHFITRYRLTDDVTLHGAGTDVPALLAKSDIMLLPSSNEGLALVCYEAIENGCIPISSDVGAQREITADETLVSRAPLKAYRESVRVIEKLLKEPNFAERVEAAQLRKFNQLRNEPSAQEVIKGIYSDALTAVTQGGELDRGAN